MSFWVVDRGCGPRLERSVRHHFLLSNLEVFCQRPKLINNASAQRRYHRYHPSTSLLAQHLFFDTSRVPSGSVSKKTKERYYGGGGGRGVEMRMRDVEGMNSVVMLGGGGGWDGRDAICNYNNIISASRRGGGGRAGVVVVIGRLDVVLRCECCVIRFPPPPPPPPARVLGRNLSSSPFFSRNVD